MFSEGVFRRSFVIETTYQRTFVITYAYTGFTQLFNTCNAHDVVITGYRLRR